MPKGVYIRTKPARRISEAEKEHLRRVHTGKKLTEEHKAKLSAAKLGKPGPWAGRQRGSPSAETRAKMAASARRGPASNLWGKPPLLKVKWVEYNGTKFRSSWEVRFAKALDRRGIKWKYECRAFDLGHRTYTPDFYTPHDGAYWEVKGWLNADSRDKIDSFRRLHPEVPLVVVTKPVLQLMEH